MRTPTSIYHQQTGLVYAISDPVSRIDRNESAGSGVSVDSTRQCRAAPNEHLLPNTRKWLDALPPRVQPYALRKLYPRIANLLVAMWADPKALSAISMNRSSIGGEEEEVFR